MSCRTSGLGMTINKCPSLQNRKSYRSNRKSLVMQKLTFFIPNMQGCLCTCSYSEDSASVRGGSATSYEGETMHCGSIWTWQHSTCAAKVGTVATYGGLRTLVLCCSMKQHPKNECMILADDDDAGWWREVSFVLPWTKRLNGIVYLLQLHGADLFLRGR